MNRYTKIYLALGLCALGIGISGWAGDVFGVIGTIIALAGLIVGVEATR